MLKVDPMLIADDGHRSTYLLRMENLSHKYLFRLWFPLSKPGDSDGFHESVYVMVV